MIKTSHKVAGISAGIAVVIAMAVNVYTQVGPKDIYPNKTLTPGAVNTSITQANINDTICNPNWSTKSIRPPSNYTTSLKIKQITQYGYVDTLTTDYEEDHLISLELGGSPTDPKNLWPEPYKTSIPNGGAKSKDTVENFLHSQVCSGKITLQEAQSAIVKDWYKVYKAINNLGVVSQDDNSDESADNSQTI